MLKKNIDNLDWVVALIYDNGHPAAQIPLPVSVNQIATSFSPDQMQIVPYFLVKAANKAACISHRDNKVTEERERIKNNYNVQCERLPDEYQTIEGAVKYQDLLKSNKKHPHHGAKILINDIPESMKQRDELYKRRLDQLKTQNEPKSDAPEDNFESVPADSIPTLEEAPEEEGFDPNQLPEAQGFEPTEVDSFGNSGSEVVPLVDNGDEEEDDGEDQEFIPGKRTDK